MMLSRLSKLFRRSTTGRNISTEGLLNKVGSIENAKTFTQQLDLQLMSKSNIAQKLYTSALQDVDNNPRLLNPYLNDIYQSSTAFVESNEIWDREELRKELNTIISMKGCMVCLLAGRNLGKSLIVQDLDHRNLEKVFVVNLREHQHIADGLQITLQKHFHENENILQKLFGAAWKATHVKLPSALKFVEIDSEKFLQHWQNKPIVTDRASSQKQTLHHLIEEMTKELPNITIIIDEANIIFDHSLHESSTESVEILKQALALFTCYTKEKHQMNVIFVSSDSLFPYKLQSSSLQYPMSNFHAFLYCMELSPQEMYTLLRTRWQVGDHLAHTLIDYYGGHLYDIYQLLIQCKLRFSMNMISASSSPSGIASGAATTATVSKEYQSSYRFLDCTMNENIRSCLRNAKKLDTARDRPQIDHKNKSRTEEREESVYDRLLQILHQLAERGFVPISSRYDEVVDLVHEHHIAVLVPNGSYVMGLPEDIWAKEETIAYDYLLLPTKQSVRIHLAKLLMEKRKLPSSYY